MAVTVLIVEDRRPLSYFLEHQLNDLGYETLVAETGKEGLAQFLTHDIDVVLLDLRLPDTSGMSVLQELRMENDAVPVIIMTAYAEVETAVEAIKQGAFDYLPKTCSLSDLQLSVEKAVKWVQGRRLPQFEGSGDRWIVGDSPKMRKVASVVDRVAPTDANTLIVGESGTGKEVVARELHQRSHRRHKPFRPINCAGIPDQLLESELFGHEIGAFTGAKRQHKGLLEVADGGTVFLDEISSMPLKMQAKLLRVLEDKMVRRLGGEKDIRTDVRFVSASNRDLNEMIQERSFREDLYWRLSVIPVQLVPLRERRSDVWLFVAAFIEHFNQTTGRLIRGIDAQALELMQSYNWPGNIRELRNVIERAVILCDGDEIKVSHLPAEIASQTTQTRVSQKIETGAEPAQAPTSTTRRMALGRRQPSFDKKTREALGDYFRSGDDNGGADNGQPIDLENGGAPSGVAAFVGEDPQQQIVILKELIGQGADYLRLWLGAELLAALLPNGDALRALEAEARADGGFFPHFLLALGLSFERIGDCDTAQDYLLQTIALEPESHYAFYDLGWVQRESGRYEDATNSFRRALSLQPDFVDAFNQLGITYLQQSKYSRALEAFENAIALETENPHHYYNTGYVHQMAGNYDGAVAAFTRALEFDPDYEDASRDLKIVQSALETLTLDVVNRVPALQALSLENRLMICERLQPMDFKAGDVVMKRGAPGDTFYIVDEGSLQVTIPGEQGSEITINELKKGDYCGEISLLEEGALRTATVTALTPARLLGLSREDFERVNKEFPSVALNLVQTRSERLRMDVRRALESGNGGDPGDRAVTAASSWPLADEGDDQALSVLAAHVIPSSAFTEALGRRTMLRFLKEFYQEMTKVILLHGVVQEYTGDRLVAYFEEVKTVVDVAFSMHKVFDTLTSRWKQESPVVPELRIGIATGQLAPQDADLDGDAIEIAKALAQSHLPDPVLVDRATAEALAKIGDGLDLQLLESPLEVPNFSRSLEAFSLESTSQA